MDSSNNPADEGSRNLTAQQLLHKSNWIKGPESLWQSEEHWSKIDSQSESKLEPNDLELKRVSSRSMNAQEQLDILDRLSRFFSWSRLKAAVA